MKGCDELPSSVDSLITRLGITVLTKEKGRIKSAHLTLLELQSTVGLFIVYSTKLLRYKTLADCWPKYFSRKNAGGLAVLNCKLGRIKNCWQIKL